MQGRKNSSAFAASWYVNLRCLWLWPWLWGLPPLLVLLVLTRDSALSVPLLFAALHSP